MLEKQQERERKLNPPLNTKPRSSESPNSDSVSPASTKNSGFELYVLRFLIGFESTSGVRRAGTAIRPATSGFRDNLGLLNSQQ